MSAIAAQHVPAQPVDALCLSEDAVVLEVTTSGIDKARAFPQLQFDCNPFRSSLLPAQRPHTSDRTPAHIKTAAAAPKCCDCNRCLF